MAEEPPPEVLQVLVKTLDSQTRSFEVEPEVREEGSRCHPPPRCHPPGVTRGPSGVTPSV